MTRDLIKVLSIEHLNELLENADQETGGSFELHLAGGIGRTTKNICHWDTNLYSCYDCCDDVFHESITLDEILNQTDPCNIGKGIATGSLFFENC